MLTPDEWAATNHPFAYALSKLVTMRNENRIDAMLGNKPRHSDDKIREWFERSKQCN